MGLNLSNISIQKIDLNDFNLVIVFLFTFFVTILSSIILNKYFFTPILVGLVFGWILSFYLNIINLSNVYKEPWFILPKIIYLSPKFNFLIFLLVIPITLISILEYISCLLIIDKIDPKKKIYLRKYILINSIINVFSGWFLNSIPLITYSENIKIILMNKYWNFYITYINSFLLIFLSFVGKLPVFIESIPIPVIVGVSLFIYGMILFSGIRILFNSNIDFNNFQNALLIFTTFIFGIGEFKIVYKNIEIKGLILSIIISIFLNLFFKFINYFKK